jgi:hypothetical protein
VLRLSCESRAYPRALVSSNRREVSRAQRGLTGTAFCCGGSAAVSSNALFDRPFGRRVLAAPILE